jgi:hypothetical protein
VAVEAMTTDSVVGGACGHERDTVLLAPGDHPLKHPEAPADCAQFVETQDSAFDETL